MHIIIVGCGRVGAELARSVSSKGHAVEIIDARQRAFDRLGADFHGRTLQGSGIDPQVLGRAQIEKADAFTAVTSSDNTNIIAARVAKEIYKVPIVVARVYNPRQLPIFERFGLQTVASSSWGARRMEELMTSPQCATRLSLGNGDVEIVDARIPASWDGRHIGELNLPALPIGVTRAGRAHLADPKFLLLAGDLLHLAVESDNMLRVSQALSNGRS
jgi:trk system potassium uptake protein TrkA